MKNETTIPGVFIIESLTFEDEKDQLFEGEILSNILHLNGVERQYYYIRTKKEFLSVLSIFTIQISGIYTYHVMAETKKFTSLWMKSHMTNLGKF